MPPKGSSLASLLGTLTSAAPVDFDPEALDADQPSSSTFANGNDSDSGSGREDDDDSGDDDEEKAEDEEEYMNPRAHYADVGPSDLRKKAALSESDKINDPRYSGIKSSRAELYADEEAAEEEEASEEDDEDGEDEDEDEEVQDDDEDISEDDEEEEDEDDNAPPKKTKQLRFAQDDDDDDSEEDGPSAQASTSNSIAAQIAQSATQAKALKARRVQDADKGRQVSKQIKTYERTLETRIKAQSVLRDVNRLPDPALYTQVVSCSPTAMEPAIAVLEHLLELSETLFSLRTRLSALSSASDADEGEARIDAPATRKRKRDFDVTVPEDEEEAQRTWAQISSHDQIEAIVDDVVRFSRALEPHRRSVLDKWSLKVTSAAATAAAASNGNKFTQLRAVNQAPSSQIDSALAGDGLSRLIARTRVLRSADSKATSKLGSKASGDDQVQDDQVFDDTDFYSTLLKELIERRSGTAGAAGGPVMFSNMLQAAGKKKKQNVDTRASKGRKLRYEVNDKLVNFMPPIRDRVKWGEDQIERLFRQLASSSMGVVAERAEAEDVGDEPEVGNEGEEAELGGLRVFG